MGAKLWTHAFHRLTRFRQVPTFGRDTIRRFCSNVSELKRLAARDHEDILQVISSIRVKTLVSEISYQCIIPVFEDLLPEPHNSTILRLLFRCAHWHAFAKLRLHTDTTLEIFRELTSQLGSEFRAFTKNTCAAFDTRELKREMESRKRRQTKNADKSSSSAVNHSRDADSEADGPRPRRFNLHTYKYHSLGDYERTIREYGTSDSFSTESVSSSFL